MSGEEEYRLVAPPGDGISDVKFSPSLSNLLLVSSWDSTTRLYDATRNASKATFNYKAASLTCCFQNDDIGYGGGLDKTIHSLDLQRGTSKTLITHDAAISCMQWSSSINALFSGSWDCTVSVHDPRAQQSAEKLSLPGKVYSLSLNENKAVVATSERHILVYDIRNYSIGPVEVRESPLKYQTRVVSCFLDGSAFAMGSIEGRVAVEYFNDSNIDSSDIKETTAIKPGYTFKCHRRGTVAFPINTIAFHPVHGTFATGGCDGTVSCWDGYCKKKLCQLHQYPTSISAISYSHDGSLLAIASSYTFEEGEKADIPNDDIFIRFVKESEVKRRQIASK